MKYRKLTWLVVFTILAVILSSCNLGATPVPTQDLGAVQTQAFNSIMTQAASQQTQTAAVLPQATNTLQATSTLSGPPTFAPVGGSVPTITPFGFNTQQPGITPLALKTPVPTLGVIATVSTANGCNDGKYIGESPPADGTVIKAGKHFTKSWQIENTGTCTWEGGYTFYFMADVSTSGLVGYSITISKRHPEDFTKPKSSQTFVLKLTAPATAGDYKGYWRLKDASGNFFGPRVYVWFKVQ